MNFQKSNNIFLVTCPSGITSQVKKECEKAGLTTMGSSTGDIVVSAKQMTVDHYIEKTNLAHNVYKEWGRVKFNDYEELYGILDDLKWDEILTKDSTFKINLKLSLENSHSKINTLYVTQRTKDSIVDFFMKHYQSRPSVHKTDPEAILYVVITRGRRGSLYEASLSFQVNEEPLYQRNYRGDLELKAPIKENLALGLLLKANAFQYDGLYDPMCGSGTFLFEFLRHSRQIKSFKNLYIRGGDTDPRSIENCEVIFKNFESEFSEARFKKENVLFQENDPKVKLIVTNLPYGKRIQPRDMIKLYKEFNEWLTENYPQTPTFLLIPDEEKLFNIFQDRICDSWKLRNGPLKVRFIQLKKMNKYER